VDRIKTTAPIATVSEANKRCHWSVRARRVKSHRRDAFYVLKQYEALRPDPPVVVTLTRISPRGLDDDNLRSALKGTRDGVADWLGIDDGSDQITWKYGQERGRPKEQAVRIEIEEA